jgi:hypothetical protein
MKNLNKLFALAILVLAFNTSVFAQVTATATASATIITPISIVKTADLVFGNVAINSSLGTVVINPAGSRSATGGVTLPATAGTVSAASFTVSGEAGYTFSITLPSGATSIDDDASHTMTVDNWVSDPTSTATLSGGTSTVNVGATLNIGANQAAGVYTSDTPFNVTVNYN